LRKKVINTGFYRTKEFFRKDESKSLIDDPAYALIRHQDLEDNSACNILRMSDTEKEYLYTIEYTAGIRDGSSRPMWRFPNTAATWGEFRYVICNVGYLAAIQARASVNKDKTAIKSELLSLNLSVDQFVEEVWKEKIREFIFEFKLWNDITRTRKYPAADSDGTFHFVDLIGAENPFGHTFTEDKIYFPICSQELQRNPALTETPE
jgi:hypothetical protein